MGLMLLLLAGMTLGAGVPRLSAMSYNIRYDNPEDTDLWRDRQEEIVELIAEMRPDLLGVQEALKHQVEDLAAGLTGYTHVGVGRVTEVGNGAQPRYQPDAGEFNAIFYRTDKLRLLESSTFWLSNTPSVAGSTLEGASLPRIVTWARFAVRASGKVFVVFNTHFPYESGSDGEAARAFSAELILKRLPQLVQDSLYCSWAT